MAPHTPNPNPNAFVRSMRKVYNPIGFQKGYNFTLFFIFAGALLGFLLARTPYLNVNVGFHAGAAPGEWFWYSKHFYKIGITLHLVCIIPSGLLAILQFVPVIRHKARLFHRINGYAVVLLLLLGNVGALMIARHAFGGTLATQAAVGVLAIATTTSACLAYYNIKCLQIEQHRAWMLRTFFYAGSIITLRLIMIIAALVISQVGDYYNLVPCKIIAFTSGSHIADTYAACKADPEGGLAAVQANIVDPQSGIEAGVALEMSFGMAFWLALFIHAVGVEIYLALTPVESERLRRVSYERQLERGFKHPGSAGLTVDRLGDAEEWRPPGVRREVAQEGGCGQGIVESKVAVVEEGIASDGSSEVSKPASVQGRETLGWR